MSKGTKVISHNLKTQNQTIRISLQIKLPGLIFMFQVVKIYEVA